MSFQDVQNGLYNFMMQVLGFTNANNLQLIQPGAPLPSNTSNATLWSWMNDIPAAALASGGGGGDQFFSNYEDCMSALTPSVNINFQGDVGAAAYNAFMAYMATLPTPPTPTQMPGLFYNWAFTHGYFSVAEKGSSDLSAMILEPVYRAQLALMPYQQSVDAQGNVHPGKAPDWSLGYAQLVSQLAAAPSKSGNTTDVQSNSNVSGAWASSSSGGGFLLWGGGSSSSASSISTNFASKAVSIRVSFAHALSFVPVPGAWYDSGCFGLAYSSNGGSPWNSTDTEVTWSKMFGPSGLLQRFATTLVVVSGLSASISSAYAFSASEQATVNQSSGGGFWPFYSSGSSSSITSSHSFNSAGQLTISFSSPANVPILLGVIVQPVAKFVGAAVTGRTNFLNLIAHLTPIKVMTA